LPGVRAPAPDQFAAPVAVETDPTDATAKSGSERVVPGGGSTVADRPHAAAAASNPTAEAALGISSASHGASAADLADSRKSALPLSEIAVTIAAQARSGKSRFDIRLDPPELGRIDVQLNVDSGGNVSSRLIVERPETLDLLRRDALQLERALQDAGLNTGNGMQFSLADQGFASRNGVIDQAVRAPLVAAVDEPAAPVSAYAAAARRRGGLDITV
jgi:flagellar hook-length control protein FliK